MFSFKDYIQHIGKLQEKLTLQYHKTLNQKIFDGEKLRPEVKDKLLDVAAAWQKFAKIPDELVKDIILTGGNCQFNYTKYSDLDCHIVMNRNKLFGPMRMPDAHRREYIDDYLDDKKTLWSSSRDIKIKGYSVEMYAQDVRDKLAASGIYSLKNNKWIVKPVHGNYNFAHDEALEKKVDEIKNTINNMIENNASEAEFKIMKEKLKNMRNAALASGNEFSFDNCVFKELRNEKVLDKMNKYLQSKRDKELSLEGIQP